MDQELLPVVPEKHDFTPQRNVEVIEARRALVRDAMLSGMDRRVTNGKMIELLAREGYEIGLSTLLEDKKAVEDEVREHYKDERLKMVERTVARLLRHAAMYEEAASDAKAAGKHGARIQALRAADEAYMSAAKVAGVLIERTEHSGSMLNMNMEVSKQQYNQEVRDLIEAAKDSGVPLEEDER